MFPAERAADFFTANPKYRTKERLENVIHQAEIAATEEVRQTLIDLLSAAQGMVDSSDIEDAWLNYESARSRAEWVVRRYERKINA